MNSLKKGEGVPLLNLVGGPGLPLLHFEVSPGVPLLNFEAGPRSRVPGSRCPRCRGPVQVLHHTFVDLLLGMFFTYYWLKPFRHHVLVD